MKILRIDKTGSVVHRSHIDDDMDLEDIWQQVYYEVCTCSKYALVIIYRSDNSPVYITAHATLFHLGFVVRDWPLAENCVSFGDW